MAQELEIFQSLWAMQHRIPGKPERPIDETFELVAAAGYSGLCLDLAPSTGFEDASALRGLFERHRLGCSINAFPDTVEGLRSALHLAKELDARFVNVIGRVMPISLSGMVPIVRAWIAMADDEGVRMQFETHRNCITNDLFTVLQLLDAVPEMTLCADLSHIVVDREFRHPICERDQALVTRVLERSECFQGRVASREQIQLQVSFPQHQKWFDVFAGWWKEGFRLWRRRSQPDAVLNFLCELGPPEYAITGADGLELSDRWNEALKIRERVEAIWQSLDDENTTP